MLLGVILGERGISKCFVTNVNKHQLEDVQ